MILTGKTILVTGGAGFIGSHVTKNLIERGSRVIIVDNLNQYYDASLKKARLSIFLSGLGYSFYEYDISKFSDLERVFSENKIDLICHLAAQAGVRYSMENPFAYGDSNLLGMINLLELAQRFGVAGFIFASSSSIYGDSSQPSFSEDMHTDKPVSIYAATKKSKELLAHAYHSTYGMHLTALRYFTVYGPWGRPDMALFKFTKAILCGDEIEIYNHGDQERDFTHIDDIVNGTLLALEKNYPFEIINLGNGCPEKLMDFIGAVETALGMKAKMRFVEHQKGDVKKTSANIEKAKKLLGWEPKISIHNGVKTFTDWYCEHHGVISNRPNQPSSVATTDMLPVS